MPEGDTIHRIARALGPILCGRRLDRIALRDRGEVDALTGARVESVEAVGKHLLVHFQGDWSLRVHLGMNGRVTRHHVRQPLRGRPTAVLVSGETLIAVERAFTAELVRTTALRAHPKLARLGPDLLADPPALEDVVRRARRPAYRAREIGDLLLDQRVAAGIGNVYKSEVLFECRVHPRTPVGDLAADRLRGVYETAAARMRENLATRRRTTVPLRRRARPSSERLWVYGREGKPCLECGSAIERFLQGDMARSTYFCPGCQPDIAHPHDRGTFSGADRDDPDSPLGQ
jgi:endonuclease VIII